jgi:signal transduction histidine kinase/BarA-like signal transduction histidine kinase
MTAALQSGGEIDAILSSNLRSIQGEWVLDTFDPSDFYVMVRRDDTELLAEINHAISQMDMNLLDWRHDLWNKYYTADSRGEIAFTAEEKAYLDEVRASGAVIRAIVEPDRAPYSYFENGEAKGIIPALFSQIAEMTGLRFEIVETKNRTEYFRTLASGTGIDVRMDAYGDYSDAEQRGYKLTSPYLTASVEEVARKSAAEPYTTVALVKAADPTAYREAVLNSGADILEYESIEECFDAVKRGDADATYLLSYTAQQYMNDSDIAGTLKSTLFPQYSIPYAIGVANTADGRLLTILDKAVANLNRGDVESIILSETVTRQHAMTLRDYFVAHPAAIAAACMLFALILAMAVLLLYRQKNMKLIEEKNRELQAEALRADKASAAKSKFLSSMSHDMRTPLNGVVSFTSFALKADTLEKKQAYLEKAQQSASLLMGLINDTLEVSRIESGKMELQQEWTGLCALIDGITLVIQNSAAEKGLAFVKEVGFSEDMSAFVDRLKMQDLLMNLLTNAIRYTPAGGTVRLSVAPVEPPCAGKNLRIVVADTGIGISEEFMPNLYEPFAQECDPRVNSSGGTGLGLYIVHKIITLMDGTIAVKSQKDKGTEFTVCLPVRMEKRPRERSPEIPQAFDFSGKRVLLVEDNAVNTEIASTILSSRGITVVCAENGEKGTDLFSASPDGTFDAILMDIHMPVMDGYEATAAIRAMKRRDAGSVPIVAMTADAYEEDVARCLAAGMNGHTPKPVDPEQLFRLLAKVMDARPHTDAAGSKTEPQPGGCAVS